MCTKTCSFCKKEKNFSEFGKCKKGKDGLKTRCKECRKIEIDEYRSRPYIKEKNKKYYQDNKESFRKRMEKHRFSLNGQFHEYKKRAKKGNKEFLLTEEECKPFFETNCFYCNDLIKGLGIDRIDNEKGYIKGNIVPCCSQCNFMKYTYSQEQFFNKIKKIVKNLKIQCD